MSTKRPATIIVCDDDPGILQGVCGLLRDEGHRPTPCRSAAEAFAALQAPAPPPQLLLLDLRMPRETGLELLTRLPRPLPCPVVVLSGEASVSEAVQAIKLGAVDFIEKPPTPERLLTAVDNALALSHLAAEVESLRDELRRPSGLVGESEALRRVREAIAKVGPTDATVLITGETGTGKERVASALHAASRRAGRLVAVNCAAIPATLLESELFGYERGAFTGATTRRLGRIEQADGGTLFLDELGDMPLELQAKLLRVLEARQVERLGGAAPVSVNVRVLAATHQDLAGAVAKKTFREDLYYRLNVFPLALPPLRERPDDVVPLMRAFAAELARDVAFEVDPDAERGLRAYRWPGNVRELKNFVERVLILRSGQRLVVTAEHVSTLVGAAPGTATAPSPELGERGFRELVEAYERSVIRAALERSDQNLAAAARLLKVDRGNLHRRAQALGLLE